MNAAKALLSSKNITFDPYHGVTELKPNKQKRIQLVNEGVKITQNGIVPSLAKYYGEPETAVTHNLKDLFFNIPCIHRTYSLTFVSQKEMFVPLKDCKFVFDRKSKLVFCQGLLSNHARRSSGEKRLPASLILVERDDGIYIRSHNSIPWKRATSAKPTELKALMALQKSLRFDLQYISGSDTLWYIKLSSKSGTRLRRAPPTIMLMAAHRLSELCRYKPGALSSYLDGKQSWLLSEFVEMCPFQFIDEIASEITGYQFIIPNVRTPA